jgi:hypothetical protein
VIRQAAHEERWARALAALAAHGGGAGALCAACAAGLPRLDGASVTLIAAGPGSGARDRICVTDGVAAQLEELQFVLGEGPCGDAFARGGPVLTADLTESGAVARWPVFAPAALVAGAAALFVFPMQVGAIRVGVVSWYRGTPGSLSTAELADALIFTDVATLVLLREQSEEKQPGEGGCGDDRPLLRAKVQQATGMISVQLGVGLGVALSRLRASAYVAGRPVDEMAEDVISRRVRFDDGAPGRTDAPPDEMRK